MFLESLTAERLTRALRRTRHDAQVADVHIVSTSKHGSERVSTADRVLLDLVFAPGGDAGLPRRMLLKTFLDRPHAPHVMYRTEARFYAEVRPELDIETPHAFGTLTDEQEGRYGVLLEDLSSRHARFPLSLIHI